MRLWVFLPSIMYDAHLSGRTCRPRSEYQWSKSERAAWWSPTPCRYVTLQGEGLLRLEVELTFGNCKSGDDR